MSLTRRLFLAVTALAIATALWLPAVHLLYRPRLSEWRGVDAVGPKAHLLAARHLALWKDPALRSQELGRMRATNPEWDFMGRTFLVLSLANMSFREPQSRPAYLRTIDTIVDDTLALERAHGMYTFLMAYARAGKYLAEPARSLFVDGEIALMLGVRRLLEEKPEWRPLLQERVTAMIRAIESSAALVAESYPNEGWIFDHCMALAAIKIADLVDGQDHSAFITRWLQHARKLLTDPGTGMLISSVARDGSPLDGPEGSTIWLVSHCLQVIDEPFARDQYQRAKKELARSILGFGYASEWPRAWKGRPDVDSGVAIPGLGLSVGSSGMAFIGASGFDDTAYLSGLLTTLNFGAFPVQRDGKLSYSASNQVGDAVLLYAMVLGPLWKDVTMRSRR